MLAMIEINLLPEEFRPREKTNVGLIGTVAVRLLLSGLALMLALGNKKDHTGLETKIADKKNELAQKKAKVKEVKDLESEIGEKKKRQNTIIKISQSKVMWSLKLQQFSEITQDFPTFWINSMDLAKTKKKGSKSNPASEKSILTMQCGATGAQTSFREVARFQDALKDDPTFFYHFQDLKSNSVEVEAIEDGFNFKEKLVFTVELPLRDPAPVEKKKSKKKGSSKKKPKKKPKPAKK